MSADTTYIHFVVKAKKLRHYRISKKRETNLVDFQTLYNAFAYCDVKDLKCFLLIDFRVETGRKKTT